MRTFTFKDKLFGSTAAYLVPQWFKNGFERPSIVLAFQPGVLPRVR